MNTPVQSIHVINIGHWFLEKWRERARQSSVFSAATQMRKQGVPLDVALSTLGVKL